MRAYSREFEYVPGDLEIRVELGLDTGNIGCVEDVSDFSADIAADMVMMHHVSVKALLACGIFSMWLFQIFINVGMTLGIMPVTGIPLPFMSYGGSALLMNLLCVGLLMNIYLRRKKLMFD